MRGRLRESSLNWRQADGDIVQSSSEEHRDAWQRQQQQKLYELVRRQKT
jgi:hypothetical protein